MQLQWLDFCVQASHVLRKKDVWAWVTCSAIDSEGFGPKLQNQPNETELKRSSCPLPINHCQTADSRPPLGCGLQDRVEEQGKLKSSWWTEVSGYERGHVRVMYIARLLVKLIRGCQSTAAEETPVVDATSVRAPTKVSRKKKKRYETEPT